MEAEKKFRIKTYIKYLLISPFTEKVSLPNPRTILWIAIFISLLFRWGSALVIFLIIQVILYLYHEYESGVAVYWYRNRKYKESRDAIKKVREERKEKQEDLNKEVL